MKSTAHRMRGPLRYLAVTAAAAAAAPACSSEGGERAGFDLPTALTVGGPVLSSPRVQPIYFARFPYPTDIDTFVTRLSTSTYWPTVVAEYGVGALVAAPGYTTGVTVPATVTEATLPGLLEAALGEGAATVGPARADTVYALFFDPATKVVIQDLSFCGSGNPSAYHDEWTVGGMQVPVAVIPTCPRLPSLPSLTGVDVLTLALSHELVEAATDPLAQTHPAYTAIDKNHVLWAMAMNGAEVADLCENEVPLGVTPDDVGYPVQRIWSNVAAKAGTGPCLPVPPGEVFFQGVAEVTGRAEFVTPSNQTITVPVLKAGVGLDASAQVTFRAGVGAPAGLSAVVFELDDATSVSMERPVRIEGGPGRTVTAPIAVSSSSASGVFPLLIGVADAARTTAHLWVGGISRQ